MKHDAPKPRVVVVGGGFAGLYAARELARGGIPVTLIDRRNFHLFQPLLYQVATGGLSPGDITAPLRSVLRRYACARVLQSEVVDISTRKREVVTRDGRFGYDVLVLAPGVRHFYFGHDDWECDAPGLKTVEDALEMRRRIFHAFEAAEKENDEGARRRWMRFVVIGGGPTGVELAGALGELAHSTLAREFRVIDPAQSDIVLLEGGDRILPAFPERLSRRAERSLERLGVTVHTGAMATGVAPGAIAYTKDGAEHRLEARTILWAAGIVASPLGGIVARTTRAELDGTGRVRVGPDLAIAGHPKVYVIGDLAAATGPDGRALPGVAPVAMQQGRYVGRHIRALARARGGETAPFRYRNKGNLAVIGRNAAVADFGRVQVGGRAAWLVWVAVHIWYLIEFDNKVLVMVQWAFNYFTRKRGARLITNEPADEKEPS